MNREWAQRELGRFVRMSTTAKNATGQVTRRPATRPEMQQAAQVVEQILDQVLRDWRNLPDHPGPSGFGRHRAAAHRAIAQLKREDEIRENLGEAAPQLDAQRLHPWVWEPAKLLWRDGHYPQAVSAAAIKVNVETQTKLGRGDISETALFQEAFSPNQPTAGRPRLRLMDDDGSDTYRNRQIGAMNFAQGCYMALRNPLAHEVADELTEHEALEQLSAFSLLARWVDAAKVE